MLNRAAFNEIQDGARHELCDAVETVIAALFPLRRNRKPIFNSIIKRILCGKSLRVQMRSDSVRSETWKTCARVPFARSSSNICIKAQRYVCGVSGISQDLGESKALRSPRLASRGGLRNYFRNFKSINVAAILMTPSPRHGIVAYFMHANSGDTGDMTLQRNVQRPRRILNK